MPNFVLASMQSLALSPQKVALSPAFHVSTMDVATSPSVAELARPAAASAATSLNVTPVLNRDLAHVVARPVPSYIGKNGLIATDQLRVLDPGMWNRIGDVVPPASNGVTRDKLDCPLTDTVVVSDVLIFQGATNGVSYHLPRYRLATHSVNGVDQYIIRMEHAANDWILRVGLEKFRAPEIAAAPVTSELAHDLLVRLTFNVTMAGGGTTSKELPFQDIGVTQDGSLVVATLHFSSPAERDQVLAAITTANAAAGLQISRAIRVGIPATPLGTMPGAQLYRAVTRGVNMVAEPNPLFLNLALNRYLFDGDAPAAGGLGLTPFQLQWKDRFFTYWQDTGRPELFYYLPDSFRLARRSQAPFLPMLSIKVVGSAAKAEDAQMSFEFVAVPWVDPARLAAARHELAKRVKVTDPTAPAAAKPGDLGGLLGGLLGHAIGGDTGSGVGSMVGGVLSGALGAGSEGSNLKFEPLIAAKSALWLALPGAGGAAGGLAERPGAQVDMRTALVNSELFSLTQFQAVWTALFGGSLSLLRGEVRIDLGNNTREVVPVSVRLDETAGDVLEIVSAPGTKPNTLKATLTNTIESAILIRRFDAITADNALMTLTTPDGKPLALPVTLPQSATLELLLTNPGPPLPEGKSLQASFDVDAVAVKGDPQAVWTALLDPTTPADFSRSIDVEAFGSMFDAPAASPDDKVQVILVEFENGSTVQLTPAAPKAAASVRTPLFDLVLQKGGNSEYRYRCKVMRKSSRLSDQDWRTDSTEILFPELPSG